MIKKTNFFLLYITFLIILSACSLPFGEKTIPGNDQSRIIEEKEDGVVEPNDEKSIEQILADQSNIKKFENPEDLNKFLEESGNSSFSYYEKDFVSLDRDLSFNEGLSGSSMSGDAFFGESSLQDSSGSDYSQTNVQVKGVDESDIVKTDGEYIYYINNKKELFIVLANPSSEADIVSKIKFDSNPQNIYINGDKLVVFGSNSNIFKEDFAKNYKRRSPYTYFKVFDIKDKSNPKLLKNYDFEGSYTNSRMIDGYIYFVTSTYSYHIYNEPILPRIIENSEDVSCIDNSCPFPNVYYFDIPYNRYNFTSVNVIDLENLDKDIEREIYILSGNQNMYVSKNNIYITYTKNISENSIVMEVVTEMLLPRLPEGERLKIEKIKSTENFILNENEKIEKIRMIIEKYVLSLAEEDREKLEEEVDEKVKEKYEDISKELEKTVIHKISINKDKVEYKNSGEVTGYVLNQFSMDESDGYFRIATTKRRTFSRYEEESRLSYSNIYILDSDLKQVGAVENLAPDERIYSARFMQGRAYLVTFKEVDPLFVVDVSVPTSPRVLGELKIPGFSNYLHPYDENTLIGLGKDAYLNDKGRVVTGGLKISLFDVSDVSNPKEADSFIAGDAGSDSLALSDHRAFLFSAERNLLVVPATIREKRGETENNLGGYGDVYFRGALWFDISKDKINLKSRVSHSDDAVNDKRNYWNGYYYYDTSVKRTLYIDDVLYTVSDKYIKMNSFADLSEVNKVELELEAKDDFEIIN